MSEFVQEARVRLVGGVDPFDAAIVSLLIKRAYRFAPGRGVIEAVEPAAWVDEQIIERCADRPGAILGHDTELFAYKCWTDVVVMGHVVAARERPVSAAWASVQIGKQRKDVLVVGDRHVERGRFSEPEPFVRLPLCWTRAYGGVDSSLADPRVPISVGELMRCLPPELHPGAYPRNPVGTGWVTNAELEGLVLPNFEDPRRPLTPERLVVTDRRLWSLAPEPQGFGWVHPSWYPRSAFLGRSPVEPPVDDEFGMPEVAAGWVPRGFSHTVDCWGPSSGADLRFSNGAAPGLRMRVRGGELLGLVGFMPQGEVVLRLPEAPRGVRLFVRGRELDVEVALHTLLVEPDARRLTLLWAARAHVGDAIEDVTALLEGALVSPSLEVHR